MVAPGVPTRDMAGDNVQLPAADDVEDFIDKVDEVSRLIDCLQAGTITPEYVDKKINSKFIPAPEPLQPSEKPVQPAASQASTDEVANDEQRARLQKKVEEIRENLERKRKARDRYQAYVTKTNNSSAATDYNKWDMWCPSDDEDDMLKSLTPNTPEFRSMEKDINERHNRMVEQRQIAERERVKGNALFKEGRYSEAYQCYEIGLSHEKTNMALHANAAMASIKMRCFVQAVTHCDKVLSIAEFLHNNTKHALCAKALHRRAVAYKALQQYSKAVEDLQAALKIEPSNSEVMKELIAAEKDLDEYNKQKAVMKLAQQASKEADDQSPHEALKKLQQVEQLVAALKKRASQPAMTPAADASSTGTVDQGKPKGMPTLPKRTTLHTQALNHKNFRELKGLLDNDDTACIYFRELDGIQVLANLLQVDAEPATKANWKDLLLLMNTICCNDKNMKVIAENECLMAGVMCILRFGHAEDKSSAVTLLSTLSSAEGPRKLVSAALAAKPKKAAGTTAATAGETGLKSLLQNLRSADAVGQVMTLSLLGNCATDKVVQAQFQQLPDSLGLKQLAACVASNSNLVTEKALVALGNLCTDGPLRKQMSTEASGVCAALLPLALPDAAKTVPLEAQIAALSTLYNITLEADALQHLNTLHVNKLVQLVKGGAPGSLLLQRAIALLSRAARRPDLAAVLQTSEGTNMLLRVLQDTLSNTYTTPSTTTSSTAPSSGPSSTGVGATSQHLATLEHTIRIVARCWTATSLSLDIASPSGINYLLTVLGTAFDAHEAIQANASLALASFATHERFFKDLRRQSAVAALIRVAHMGKGNTSSKNAAIALARLAHDAKMMEQIRELHGIEIIYQYVKP